MAINLNRYVDITSAVAGAAIASQRQLIARLFTDNDLLPPQTYIEFTSAAAVGTYFGTTSEEYKRALFYFSYVSKNSTAPQKISYARWVSAAIAPMIFGISSTQALATYTAITSGSIGITIGSTAHVFSGLDFSTATSLGGPSPSVASILQAAIRAETGTMWTAATVTFNSSVGAFDFVGGDQIAATISVQPGLTGTNLAPILKWLPAATYSNGTFTAGAIMASGSLAETITQTLDISVGLSNNFGSFLFMPVTPLTLAQNVEAGVWSNAQNVSYMFMVPVISANANSGAWLAPSPAGLEGIGSVGVTLSNFSDQYIEMLPMAIQAATDYTANNSVQNYEFQQIAGVTAGVTDDTTADAMDALSVNYYGQTQTAGQFIAFYQQGLLQGQATDPTDMGVFSNEAWLKDAAQTALMNLLLALAEIPANAQGRSQILGTLQTVINQALNNGTISVGKTLTSSQIVAIGQITNDPNAWQSVQANGYWVDVTILPIPSTSPVRYKATYTLIYSKNDVIRFVQGSDILI